MPSSRDEERVAVRTTVPGYQKAEWEQQADELGMSLAEYARTMIQAGRRGFSRRNGPVPGTPGEADDPGSNPRGRAFENRVLEILEEDGPLGWDELVAVLNDDFEDRLDETLVELRQENVVQHSPRDGTYSVIDDGR